MVDTWYNEGGALPPAYFETKPGAWVMYFVGESHYDISGVFSTLSQARKSLVDYYRPKGLRTILNSWDDNLVECRVIGLDCDGVTEINMSFYIEYRKLDEFNG